MSDKFSRRRQDGAEEHTHIHIYVPSKPGEAEGGGSKCRSASVSTIETSNRNQEDRRSEWRIAHSSKDTKAKDRRHEKYQHESCGQTSPGRKRRHRKSFDV
jgi:hypothetical protein